MGGCSQYGRHEPDKFGLFRLASRRKIEAYQHVLLIVASQQRCIVRDPISQPLNVSEVGKHLIDEETARDRSSLDSQNSLNGILGGRHPHAANDRVYKPFVAIIPHLPR